MRKPAMLALTVFAFGPAAALAADTALVYNKNYQCGTEVIQVAYCRRDSDMPGVQPTQDSENYCQVYYPSRPKNGMGGTAFGTELRGDLEKQLRACGALGGGASVPAAKPAAKPAAVIPQSSDNTAIETAEYEKGKALAKQKNYTQAIEAFRRSIAIHPSARAWNDLGIAYYDQRQHQQAAEAFRQALIIQPDSPHANYSLGVTRLQLKQYDAAIAAFREALRLNPDHHEAANQLGIACFDSGKFEEAVTAYREAVRLQPGDAAYHMNLGFAYFQLKRYADTVAEQEQALRLDPTKAAAANSLGNARYALENYREAVAAYQQATRLKPNDALYLTNGGYALIKLGRLDEARRVREQVQVLDRKLADTLQAAIDKAGPASPTTTPLQSTAQRTAESEITRGQKLYESKDYKGAIAAFQAAIPLTPDAVVAARAFRWIGASYQELKNDDKAIEALRESLRLNPRDAVAHNLLGNLHHSREDYRNAITAYQESVRLAPGNAANRLNLGVAQVDAGQDESALANLRESLRLDPEDARAWNMLGVALTNLSEDEDALPAFQEAARLEPKVGNYQFNVGSTLVVLGRLDEAGKVHAVLQPLDKALALELSAQIRRRKPPTPGSSD
jgi:tetratricopeptide (TPR) repeat protein